MLIKSNNKNAKIFPFKGNPLIINCFFKFNNDANIIITKGFKNSDGCKEKPAKFIITNLVFLEV